MYIGGSALILGSDETGEPLLMLPNLVGLVSQLNSLEAEVNRTGELSPVATQQLRELVLQLTRQQTLLLEKLRQAANSGQLAGQQLEHVQAS